MRFRHLTLPACALALAWSGLSGQVRAQSQDDTFVFMSSQLSCPPAKHQPHCYLTNPVAAAKAVAALRDAGARNVLIPSATLDEMMVIAQAIDDAGLKFYTYEHWEFIGAVRPQYPGGTFDCGAYTHDRIDAEIAPLRKRFPNAYAGLHFTDEPLQRDLANLGAQATCLRNDPRTAGMKIFVNLLPIYSNQMQPGGPAAVPDAMAPAQYGVSCAAGGITNPTAAQTVASNHLAYVVAAADSIRPDFLATNIYVFDLHLAQCPAGREFVMTEGMSAVSNVARARGLKPVAYLQNFRTAAPPYSFHPTNFHHHRWYTSWFFVFGGRQFANFLSHDDDTISGAMHHGMLTASNDSRDIAVDALNTHAYTRQIQAQLGSRTHHRFVAPFLSVPTGELIGWLPTNQIVAGEYGLNADSSAMVFFARRSIDQPASSTVSFNKWWSRVERLNFNTGLWETVGTNTNSTQVALTDFPGALYRLSMSGMAAERSETGQ
ncbi:hypothetical protein GCM10023307_00040 [Lysobacter hankyongensis]|uniref:Uncharacterized protein n=2 Tax=Lysobacter hankyongensis TaxID=1176535 RepID=A0ABP9AFG1_9GAMM